MCTSISCYCGAEAPITMSTNLGGGYQKNCPRCHGDANTASLKNYLASAECASDEAEFEAWNELQQEADAVINTYGSKAAFKYAARAGQFELSATIIRKGGMSSGFSQIELVEFITQCYRNEHRYGVCANESIEGWCGYAFDNE